MLSRTLVAALALALPSLAHARPSVVSVVKSGGGWQLTRDGKPYFINGVGGDGSRTLLAQCGGNSVRTWGADHLDKVLDDAHKHGLTVAVGIWLGHERQGFNYNSADQVAKQMDMVRDVIRKYKDHPAVLLWGLGNEMEGYEQGDNAAVWSAVNNLAVMVKRLDPNHPTMTVVAEIGGQRVLNLHRLCPDVDVVGINSYGDVLNLDKRYRAAGGTKPYVITEFGPPGQWELKKTAWGAAPEPTSTEKAEIYRKAYEATVAHKDLCLGSYAFLWGHKQEATATWFGMLLPDGSRLGAVDALAELWSGKAPASRCPTIRRLALDGPDKVKPGATVRATLEASDPEGDPLKVRWVLQREGEYGSGGDAEDAPETFADAIVKGDAKGAEVKLPTNGGGYRLFAYVHDDHGGAAVANVPLFVDGPVTLPAARKATLPLVLYDEAATKSPFVPAGWMGNAKGVRMDEACTDAPHAGKTCIKVEYLAKDEWAGVVWQHPAGDWGDRPGGLDLTGARRLTFWARGAQGGEVVSFEFGIVGKDKRFHDTAKGKLADVRLTDRWQQFTIDLAGKDLSRVKTGFVWVVRGDGRPVVFYLDDIRYE